MQWNLRRLISHMFYLWIKLKNMVSSVEAAVAAGGEMINAFAALVADGSPAGVIWILHSPRPFPTFWGRTTPHDDKVVALVNDVWDGDSIMSVYLPEH